MTPKEYYLIGSLRNPEIPHVAARLRDRGMFVFCDWFSAGNMADEAWMAHEKSKGLPFQEALKGYSAQHVFQFDKFHLDRCDGAILVCPAGKSGHLELGYTAGRGKPTYILLDRPDRWDVMLNFATAVYSDLDELAVEILAQE